MNRLGALLSYKAMATLLLAFAILPSKANAEGQKRMLRLANVKPVCLDVSHKNANVWILSIVAPKKKGWFTEDKAVGVSVNLTITANAQADTKNKKVSFPFAQSVSVKGLGNKAVRVPVNLEMLQDTALRAGGKPDTNVSAELEILHTKGDTAAATFARGLINFAKTATTLLPATPFTSGMELAGQVAGNVLSEIKKADSDNIYAPDYPLSFSLATDPSTGECRDPYALESGLYVIAWDTTEYRGPNVIDIATADINHCFYSSGARSDPQVVFTDHPKSGECPATASGAVRPLWNPQILFSAYDSPGVAKAASSSQLSSAAGARSQITLQDFSAVLRSSKYQGIGVGGSKVTLKGTDTASVDVIRATAICKASFIPLDQCLQ